MEDRYINTAQNDMTYPENLVMEKQQKYGRELLNQMK
jgi:hypothetical protein